MKWLVLILLVLLGFLQYRLWVGEGSLAQVANLKRDIERQQLENAHLRARNQALAAEIDSLKKGTTIEDRARRDMGMIRKDETFVLLVDEEESKRVAANQPVTAAGSPHPEAASKKPVVAGKAEAAVKTEAAGKTEAGKVSHTTPKSHKSAHLE